MDGEIDGWMDRWALFVCWVCVAHANRDPTRIHRLLFRINRDGGGSGGGASALLRVIPWDSSL